MESVRLLESEFAEMRSLGMIKQRLLSMVSKIQFDMDCLDYLIRERNKREMLK